MSKVEESADAEQQKIQITKSVSNNTSVSKSLNHVISEATYAYLKSIDPLSPPLAEEIVDGMLEETTMLIDMENATRAKGKKLPVLNALEPWQIAQIVLYLYPIRRIAGAGLSSDKTYDLLALYQEDGKDKGIYVTDDESLQKIIRQYNIKIKKSEMSLCIDIISENAERVQCCTDRDLIAVNNGIFNYRTKQLMDFSPDYVFTAKCRVDYNPNAQNINIHNSDDGTDWDVESWMHTLSDDDEVIQLLWEILGAIIRPYVSWNKSAWFYSETGNNGKGTLCELMRQLCGEGSYVSIPLADMGKDFALEPLVRCSAIIVDENDVGTYVDKAANIKALITHDVIQINRKFKQAIAYRFRGFMVQCLNEMPRVKDKSDSFYRRQLFVPFEKCFTGVERKYIKDEYLHRKDVLEYVLHKVLHMDYYSLSEPEACKLALEEYKEINDPIIQFWGELGDEFTWNFLPLRFVFDIYQKWYRKYIGKLDTGKSKARFEKDFKPIILASGKWRYVDSPVSVKTKIQIEEPLIEQYDLTDWANTRYTGSTDRSKYCTCPEMIATKKYRGYERI